jgi:endonuclease/exonuclease/phosphatase family metal-dependent hydrolase
MNAKTQSSSFSRIHGYLLPAMVITFGMQLLRVFIPSLAWYLRDTVGISSLSLIPYAFGTFFLGFLAAALRLLLGSRTMLWITAGGVAVIRMIEQLIADPAVDFLLSVAGMGLFLNFLSIFIGHIRAQGDRAAPRWAFGLVLGLAFDVTLRSLFGVMDLSMISGAVPIVVVVVIAVLIFFALWLEPVVEAGIPTGTAWKAALPLLAIGPYMVLQLLFFQSQGWVEEVAGLTAPIGFVIVMLGSLAAVVGVAWGFARPRTLRPLIAIGIAIYLTLAVYWIDQPGGLVVITIFIGQLLTGWGWAVIAGVGMQADRPGLGRTTVVVGGGMVLFLALAFAFYLAQDVAMPFPRQVFPAAAAALLGLFLLLASIQAGSLSEYASWDLSGTSVAGILVIVSLISWVLIDPVPTPEQPGGYPIKVMSYNVHSGFAMEGQHDLEAIAKVIEDSGADIIALQEVSRVRLMDGAVDIPTWLSRRLDMPVLFRGTEEPIWGNAILSRYPIVESGWGELPLAGKLIERGYVWARIDVGGPEPLLVIDTHLHHIGPDSLARQEQVPVLLQFWNDQGYSVLLGDLNATPDSVEMGFIYDAGLLDSWSEEGVGPGYTSNSRDPYQRIDWIWHSQDLTTVEVEVLQTQASDHLPVLATLDLAQ